MSNNNERDIDYSKAVIYKIIYLKDDRYIYFGGTTQKLNERKRSHRHRANNEEDSNKFYKFVRENGGLDNFDIFEVEKYPSCKSVKEMEDRELYHIAEHKKNNPDCIILNDIDTSRSEYYTKNNWRISGPNSTSFTYGYISHKKKGIYSSWAFNWIIRGKKYTKSFGTIKYGEEEAKRLATEYRYVVYPELKEEQENDNKLTEEEINNEKKRLEELDKKNKYERFGCIIRVKVEKLKRDNMMFSVLLKGKRYTKQASLRKYSEKEALEILNKFKKELYDKHF